MVVEIDYGKEGFSLNLPNTVCVDVITPKYVPIIRDQGKAILNAVGDEAVGPPLHKLVSSMDSVGVAISDITRPVPYKIILPAVLKAIEHVPRRQITFFVATGTHRDNTDKELALMLGEEIVQHFKIVQNNARDRSTFVDIGQSKSGNTFLINKEFMECDKRILTGFLEPHFFAGFSGGGKAVMPGLAYIGTIMQNHSPKKIESTNARWGVTSGNPIWEEIQEAAYISDPTFLINVTLNRGKEITGVFAGEFQEAYRIGCDFAREISMVRVKHPYDIVITSNSGYPLDLNMYQSVKGMSAAAQIVKQDGSIIIAADCWDGIPDHGDYGNLLYGSKTADLLLEKIKVNGFTVQDMWQAQIHASICKKTDVYFYSRNLSETQVTGAFMHYVDNIEKTVARLICKYGRNVSVCVLPEGPQTIPYIR